MDSPWYLLLVFTVALVQPTSGGHCQNGWAQFKSNCYYFSSIDATFKDAMISCISIGANLLEFHNKREEAWVYLQIKHRGYAKGVWLGYSDIQKEGHYVTMSNAEDLGYQNWHKGEPNDWQKNEHCAAIHFQYAGWVDYHCTAKYNYICKK
ncbi:perlucin-like protein [Crassostrea angulata]|uniref:perlucin-like protein n=1 Tax=Magallana angulata TaxID=2784310 RepID=UPI0022B1093A|nr:perlucin-like protein [Crassostrea angulata]